MKTIYRLSMLLLFASILFSCEKDENKIYFQEGTAPVLSVSDSSALVLTHDNADQTAVTFSWTNPNYVFNTGVSSMNVSYLLQVDTTGSSFSNPQEISISSDLSTTFTDSVLNAVLTKLNLQENIPHDVEFRIRSSLANNSVPLYSNVIKMVITPYLDVAVPIPPTGELYITGDATPKGWINGPVGQLTKCDKISNTEYSIVAHFKPGFYYKFLSTPDQWQPQYGGSSATGGDIKYNFGLPGQSDPAGIPTPSEEADYKVDLNFKTGKYTVTKQ
jgi:hypothetical protein